MVQDRVADLSRNRWVKRGKPRKPGQDDHLIFNCFDKRWGLLETRAQCTNRFRKRPHSAQQFSDVLADHCLSSKLATGFLL